jgi:hypothetical protein
MATQIQGNLARARREKVPGGGGTPSTVSSGPSTKPFEGLVRGARRMGQQVMGVINRINSSGNNVSPSTKHDMPHPAAAEPDSAKLEETARKYVD